MCNLQLRPYLPHDLIIEILQWLPPESLVTFRTVCKLWYSTITDTKFISEHRTHFGNSSNGNRVLIPVGANAESSTPTMKVRLFPDKDKSLRSSNPEIVELGIEEGECNWNIWGSCKGVLLYTGPEGNHGNGNVMVSNPCIGRTIILPNYPFHNDLDGYEPPPPYVLSFGIGFDPISDDYKIVKMRTYPGSDSAAAACSLKSKKWRKLETLIPDRVVIGKSIFLQGFIHWLTMPLELSVLRNKMILTFDVSTEVFGEIELPKILNNENSPAGISIGILKGSLCVMIAMSDSVCELWTMKEYGDIASWTNAFRVRFPWPVLGSAKLIVGGRILLRCSAGCVAINGKPEYEFGRYKTRETFLLCDPETGEYSNVCQSSAGCVHRMRELDAVSIEATLQLLNYVGI